MSTTTAKRARRGTITMPPAPSLPHVPYETPDDRFCVVIHDEAGTDATNANYGRGMAVIYAPNAEERRKRAACVYEALRALYAQEGESNADDTRS